MHVVGEVPMLAGEDSFWASPSHPSRGASASRGAERSSGELLVRSSVSPVWRASRVLLEQRVLSCYPNPSCDLLDIHELLRSHEGWQASAPTEEEAHGRENYNDILSM
jgi:hypothetical protein